MTTELVLLLTVFVAVIVGVFQTPTRTFEESGPRLGMRLEKQIETGEEFSRRTRDFRNGIYWKFKR